jgi:Tol biopolymer transport system component
VLSQLFTTSSASTRVADLRPQSRGHWRAGSGVLAVLVLTALAIAPSALARTRETSRASVDSAGSQAEGSSFDASVSADGRYVAFTSQADNLVPGGTIASADVFVRDRMTGTTEQIGPNENLSTEPAISGDGRYVAFKLNSTVVVYDRQAGTTEPVSVSRNGEAVAGFGPSISADGRYVAFISASAHLAATDTDGQSNVFVRDRETGTTELVSVGIDGEQEDRSTFAPPSMSADGRSVAFASEASNLVPGDTNQEQDIFVRDREAGTTELVSADSAGGQADFSSYSPSISADGRFVAFASYATNLVPGDTNGEEDVFVHDRQAGTTERVSVDAAGGQANGQSQVPTISADGRYVAFSSTASNLTAHDIGGEEDVFVHDRQTGTTELASAGSAGNQGNGTSNQAVISADGHYVGFASAASNLVDGDTNGVDDIFVHALSNGTPPPVPDTLIQSRSGFYEHELSGLLRDSTPRIHFSSSATHSTFLCRLDSGEFSACSGPGANEVPTEALADGSHSVEVAAVDQNGHLDPTPAVIHLTIDTVAPDTTITGGPAALTNWPSPGFSVASDDPTVTEFECVLDGVASSCGAEPYFGTLGEGRHTLRVRAIDPAGNRDASPATDTFTIDSVAPETTITAGPTGPTKVPTPKFQFSSSETGSTYLCRLDSEPFAPCSGPGSKQVFSTALADGPHSFHVEAVDRAGNVDSSPATAAFTVDTQPPETVVESGLNSSTPGSSPEFVFYSDDSEARFECRLDAEAFTPCASPLEFTSLAKGAHVLRVRAIDLAANIDPSPATAKFAVK